MTGGNTACVISYVKVSTETPLNHSDELSPNFVTIFEGRLNFFHPLENGEMTIFQPVTTDSPSNSSRPESKYRQSTIFCELKNWRGGDRNKNRCHFSDLIGPPKIRPS
jgi:hypothetical protein